MPVAEIMNSQKFSAPHSTRALTTDVLDFEVLNAFEKVKSDDGSDILIGLIDLYLQSSSQRIATMADAARRREWSVLKREAHTLKGSSSTLGVRQIAKICQDLECASLTRGGDVQTLMSLLKSKFAEVKPVLIQESSRRRGC